MLKIGVTGSIGSGKSTVCRMFEHLGVPVYFADLQARSLMESDQQLISEVRRHFGEDTYQNGLLDRKLLASRVFGFPEKLQLLNSLVHPAVFRDFDHWADQQHASYVIKEAALMFESDSYKQLDAVVCVVAPEEERIRRTMERDQISREEVLKRMAGQWTQQDKAAASDYIIINDSDHSLIEQVSTLHRQFSKGIL